MGYALIGASTPGPLEALGLHKPPRRRDWQATLTRLGVPPPIPPAPEGARVA